MDTRVRVSSTCGVRVCAYACMRICVHIYIACGVHVCAHACVRVLKSCACVCPCVCARMLKSNACVCPLRMRASIRICVHIYIACGLHVCAYARVCVCVCVCACACSNPVRVCVRVCAYACTQTLRVTCENGHTRSHIQVLGRACTCTSTLK